MKRKISELLQLESIRTRIGFTIAAMLIVVMCINLLIYRQVNSEVERINTVFASNVEVNDLSAALGQIQNRVQEYLMTKSSTALEDYYRYEQEYRRLIEKLNDKNLDHPNQMLEKNIRNMSETFLDITAQTVLAKRGRNVERYRSLFEEESELFEYINDYFYQLNVLRFQQNTKSYTLLLTFMRRMEIFCIGIVLLASVVCLLISNLTIRTMLRPLGELSAAAERVTAGDLETELPQPVRKDEVGILTEAFRQMVVSIRDYIRQTRENMEREARLKENELSMIAHLKEAQLRYLQAQINPHFLYNSLNAGAQLAMLEDAERTGAYMEKMADFFRYNVKKTEQTATLLEELEAVDNYIYILNVRFAGEIRFEKQIPEEVPNIDMPSMILQPIVENAVQHGIREDLENGRILLSVEVEEGYIQVVVKDNGTGLSRERIEAIMEGKLSTQEQDGNSTGIAVSNVINRLQLFYGEEQLLTVYSEGMGMGTEVTILLPLKGGENHVSHPDCR